jgi:menaquinone-9 beta-reductase
MSAGNRDQSGADADVLVVGAGPAGSAAAITLARAGRSVLLVDKAEFPRDKCCGDGLTTGALRRLEALGLDPASVRSWQWADDVQVRSSRGRTVHYELPRGEAGHFAAVAMRVDLDAALVDLARAAGVKVLTGHEVTKAEQDRDGVTLDVAGIGSLRAPVAIAADGMWSPMRTMLVGQPAPRGRAPTDSGRYLGEWHAYRQYVSNVHTAASRDLWVWFEPSLLPGYAWSFPLPDGRVNLGFGIERRPGVKTRQMRDMWREVCALPHISNVLGADPVFEGQAKAWPIPCGIDRAVLAAGRTLFVGDAALACDVLTGEGIGQALQTGIAAADTVVSVGDDRPHEIARRYGEHVRDDLGPDHRMSDLLGRALRRDWVCDAAVRISGASGWTRRNFARWLFEDYPRGIAYTPSRWERGRLAGPGAYLPR